MAYKESENTKNSRKKWFRGVKKFMRLFIKPTQFIHLDGEKIKDGSIVLSNHVGTSAPLAFELYGDLSFRFWGAYQMNAGLFGVYKYLSKVYYHEKKHWNLFLARLFCIVAAPLTNMFYKGLCLISTYKDMRFKKTVSESLTTLKKGQSVVIFPEDSTKGYLDELEGFHLGFTVLASACLKQNIDAPVYVAYYKKEEKRYIVDKPIYLSELFKDGSDREEIAKRLCDRCNELGKMQFPERETKTDEAKKTNAAA